MANNNNSKQMKQYGLSAFLPLIIFLGIYLGAGILFAALGYGGDSFKQISRVAALVVGLLVCLLMGGKERSLEHRMDAYCQGMANADTMIMIVIFLLAGGFSGVASAMGGVESTANLGLSLVPHQFVFVGIFIISAFVATAMGTSMGTISAIGPIAVAVAEAANANMGVAIAAVLGGAMFGDNLSMISDTTIAATRGAGCNMRDKFKMNGLIALISAIITCVLLTFVGSGNAQISGTFEYDIVKVIPYLFILVFALTGVNVFFLLLAGIAVAGVVGLVTGSLTIVGISQGMVSGMAGMYEICIVTLMMRGMSGIVRDLGGIDWMVSKMVSKVHTRKGAEYMISAMVSLFDLALGNNTIAIILAAPLVRDMAAEHNIAPKRVASLLDIFACVVQGLIPHGGQILLCITLTELSPFTIMGHGYYMFILAIVTIITIQFGLMRTKEEKQGIKLYDENNEPIAALCK